MITVIYVLFFCVFLLFVSFLRKARRILSLPLTKQFFPVSHIISVALSEEQKALRNIPVQRSSSFWPYIGLFFKFVSLSWLKNYSGGCIHFEKKKKKPFSSRGENVAKELLSLAFLMNVTSEMPGGPSAVTDWGEAACHNRGIAPGVGEQRGDSQSHGKWYQIIQLWASSSCIQSFAFTHSSFRCRSAARSHPIQPKRPTSYSSVSGLNQLGNVLSFKLVEATNRVDLWPCFLRTPNRHPLCTLKTSSPVPLTYPAGCQDRLWLALATEANCLHFPPTHPLAGMSDGSPSTLTPALVNGLGLIFVSSCGWPFSASWAPDH